MISLGSTIGHIRVNEVLGKGGMGEVYLGYDEKLRRRVAVKTIRADQIEDRSLKQRFLQEAVILSSLDHPNICGIYDYLECDDTDYLILELVDGRSLGRAIASDNLSEAEKYRVAIQIAEVLTAAHAEGIVHRDLKPENVMLTRDGEVKVLDFGLACLHHPDEPTVAVSRSRMGDGAGQPSPERPLPSVHVVTAAGLVVGTPQYMSPEQARGRAASPASDMCSFGLVLQEMFTGKPPYDTSSRGKILLTQMAEGKTTPVEGLETDLTDLITRCKAMSPGERPSAREALDRLRWIVDKPRRRRRKIIVGLIWAVLLALSVGLGVQSWRASRSAKTARREAERATLEAQAAKEVTDFLVNLFAVSDPGEARGNSITARELLDKGAERIRAKLGDQPALQARLMNTMGTVFVKLGLHEQAEPLLEGAVAIAESLADQAAHGDAASAPTGHDDLSEYVFDLGVLYRYMGRLDQAEEKYERALAAFEKTRGARHVDVSRVLGALADLYLAEDRADEALPLLERTLSIEEEQLGPDHQEIASTLISIGLVHCQASDFTTAVPLFERAVEIYENTLGPDHMNTAVALFNLAGVERELGEYAEATANLGKALAIEEKSLGPNHPSVAFSRLGYGELYAAQGKYSEAVAEFEKCLTIWEHGLGPDHMDLSRVLNQLGRARIALGESSAAIPLLERSLAILRKNDLLDHGLAAQAQCSLGDAYRAQGGPQLAEQAYRRALDAYERSVGTDDPSYEATRDVLAELLRSLGRNEEAAALQPGG